VRNPNHAPIAESFAIDRRSGRSARDNSLIWITGFAAVAVYLVCATAAFLRYPLAYSPFTNWLSDLGDPLANPDGAWFYNLGCILVGLCLVGFSLSLRAWDDGGKRSKVLLTIAQAAGVVSALFLIASALFPLGAQTALHQITGKLHIFFAGFFLTFSATVLLRLPHAPRWIAWFGFAAALVNFIYGAFLHAVFIAEWAAIGLFIVYVLLISANAFTLPRTRAK
jgi:hypothetical membrane protein